MNYNGCVHVGLNEIKTNYAVSHSLFLVFVAYKLQKNCTTKSGKELRKRR